MAELEANLAETEYSELLPNKRSATWDHPFQDFFNCDNSIYESLQDSSRVHVFR